MFGLEQKSPKILVIGDLMIDHYIWGDCNRISPEAPVQVVEVIIGLRSFPNSRFSCCDTM